MGYGVNVEKTLETLTEKEQRFAAENFHLVYDALGYFGFDRDTYYDSVIFHYLHAVHRYLTDESIQWRPFKNIVYGYVRSAAVRAKKKISYEQSVSHSLDATHDEDSDISYADILCLGGSNTVRRPTEDAAIEAMYGKQRDKEKHLIVEHIKQVLNEFDINVLMLMSNGHSAEEIAEAMQTPVHNVRYVSRKVRRLKEQGKLQLNPKAYNPAIEKERAEKEAAKLEKEKAIRAVSTLSPAEIFKYIQQYGAQHGIEIFDFYETIITMRLNRYTMRAISSTIRRSHSNTDKHWKIIYSIAIVKFPALKYVCGQGFCDWSLR